MKEGITIARPRIFQKHNLPGGVVSIAVAIIADYDRRAREIRKGALSEDLLSAYSRYNEIVDNALSAVEAEARKEMLSDIASGRGYRHSMLNKFYTDWSYYARKRQVIFDTAISLGLTENPKE